MSGSPRVILKPRALPAGSRLAVFAPASPARPSEIVAGVCELAGLDFSIKSEPLTEHEGFFAGSLVQRRDEFLSSILSDQVDGLISVRGGYGSNYLLDADLESKLSTPKCIIGFSDITSLQVFLWQRRGWVTIHGPMVSAGFSAGAGAHKGYDPSSFLNAVRKTDGGWTLALEGETLAEGSATGRLLGGCMTLVEATMGTPWELETRDAILLLEDRAMKPYQVDRVLMHLKQAGKLDDVRGIVLGDFPDSESAVAGSPTVREVCSRILAPLGVPVVFGAPVGHTQRPLLTMPLGVMARLTATGGGTLEILEPAVVA
jgi:muramoyltetrapeptide carboxypeptidase